MNQALGLKLDEDMSSKSAMGVRDILAKDAELKESALHNSRDDFTAAYYDHLDEALMQGSADSKQFFHLLLNKPEYKKEVMGIFIDELYRELRREDSPQDE